MTKTPIEFDLDQIEAAIRRLSLLAWEEHFRTGAAAHELTPGLPSTNIGRLIASPVAQACKIAANELHRYLTNTLGKPAADELIHRVDAECMQALAPSPPADVAMH